MPGLASTLAAFEPLLSRAPVTGVPAPWADAQVTDVLGQHIHEWQTFDSVIRQKGAEQVTQQAPLLQAGVPFARVAHAATAPAVTQESSPEMQWLTENSRMLERYGGEWLLIVARELVVHSPDFEAIRTAVAEQNLRSPFVYYVPRRDEADFISI